MAKWKPDPLFWLFPGPSRRIEFRSTSNSNRNTLCRTRNSIRVVHCAAVGADAPRFFVRAPLFGDLNFTFMRCSLLLLLLISSCAGNASCSHWAEYFFSWAAQLCTAASAAPCNNKNRFQCFYGALRLQQLVLISLARCHFWSTSARKSAETHDLNWAFEPT